MYVNDHNFLQLIDNTKRISFLILNGNLGNHFYIICAALYLKQHNFEPIIIIPPLSYNKFINNELPYLNEFKCIIFSHCITSVILTKYPVILNYYDDIDDIVEYYKNYDRCILYFNESYFQHSKYFLMNKQYTLSLFKYDSDNINKYTQKINDVNKSVFISIRRGDYVIVEFYVLSNQFYIDMYNTYFEGYDIFISSDDIEYVKQNYPIHLFNNCNNIYYIDDMNAIEIINFASQFKNFICANSTFSSICELMSIYNDKHVIGVGKISPSYDRQNMFSPNITLIDIEDNNYIKYIDNCNNALKILYSKKYDKTI